MSYKYYRRSNANTSQVNQQSLHQSQIDICVDAIDAIIRQNEKDAETLINKLTNNTLQKQLKKLQQNYSCLTNDELVLILKRMSLPSLMNPQMKTLENYIKSIDVNIIQKVIHMNSESKTFKQMATKKQINLYLLNTVPEQSYAQTDTLDRQIQDLDLITKNQDKKAQDDEDNYRGKLLIFNLLYHGKILQQQAKQLKQKYRSLQLKHQVLQQQNYTLKEINRQFSRSTQQQISSLKLELKVSQQNNQARKTAIKQMNQYFRSFIDHVESSRLSKLELQNQLQIYLSQKISAQQRQMETIKSYQEMQKKVYYLQERFNEKIEELDKKLQSLVKSINACKKRSREIETVNTSLKYEVQNLQKIIASKQKELFSQKSKLITQNSLRLEQKDRLQMKILGNQLQIEELYHQIAVLHSNIQEFDLIDRNAQKIDHRQVSCDDDTYQNDNYFQIVPN